MLRRIKSYISRKLRRPEPDALAGLKASDRELIAGIRARNLTYLTDRKLAALTQTCHAIEAAGIPGIFIEAGCALGGSSILIATLKRPDRPFFIHDAFGMIPPPTEEDTEDVHRRYRTIMEGKSKGIRGDQYYGYVENLHEVVQNNLAAFGIDLAARRMALVKGLVQETLVVDQPVAFAHVDVDWYEPVLTCLSRIFPRLVVGGSIILDDYHDWGGCRKAADEYFRTVTGQFSLDDSGRSMKMTRTRANS